MKVKNWSAAFLGAALSFSAQSFGAAPPGKDDYLAAVARFKELAAVSNTRGEMPKRTDPQVATVMNTLSDTSAILGTQTYEMGDLNGLTNLCSEGTKIAESYLSFGLQGLKDDRSIEPRLLQSRLREQASVNLVTYQDEVLPLLAFQLQCMGRAMSSANAYVSGLPAGKITARERQVLHGWIPAFSGQIPLAMGYLSVDGVSSENKTLILTTLAKNADAYAQILPIDQRDKVLAMVAASQQKSQESLRPRFDPLVGALRNRRCIGFCAL